MKISRGRLFFLGGDAHAPARLVGTTKRTPGGSRSGLGTLLAALACTSSPAVTSAPVGGGGAAGAGGEALRSAPMLMFVVCEGGRVVRGGGPTDVSIGLSACLLSGVGGGGAPTFFPVNAVKCGGCSSEGADKSQGRLRSVARTEPSVPE